MRNVDLSLVADYTMPAGLGTLNDHQACFVAQANILDALSRGESIAKLSDSLECACPVLRVLGIALNDVRWWKNDEERTETLRPLLPLLLDSRRSPAVTAQRAQMASEFASFAAKSAAKSAAKYAAKYAEYAAEFAKYAKYAAKYAKYAKYAAKYAEYAAEFAKYAKYAAKYAEYAAEYAAKYAEYAAEFAAEFAAVFAAEFAAVPLRDELLRVWKAMEALQEVV